MTPAAALLAASFAALLVVQVPAPPTLVHVAIEDARGTPLQGITAADLEVLLDDEPVKVETVAARGPLSVMVLVDVSRSARWAARPLDEQVETLAALGPGGHVSIGTFGAAFAIHRLEPRANIRTVFRRALDVPGDQRNGPSPVWDAVHEAVSQLAKAAPPRAIVLLTDGRATGNRYGLAEAADYAAAHGVSVHVVARHTAVQIPQRERVGRTAARVRPEVLLERLAAYTGGQVFTYPEQPREEADRIFAYIAERLRGLYAVAVASPPPGARRLEVRVRRQGAHVHAPAVVVTR